MHQSTPNKEAKDDNDEDDGRKPVTKKRKVMKGSPFWKLQM